jgi:hypothetical protein
MKNNYVMDVCDLSFVVPAEIFKDGSLENFDRFLKNKNNCIFIGFVCDFTDFLCEFTVKTIEHTVASYKSSDFT